MRFNIRKTLLAFTALAAMPLAAHAEALTAEQKAEVQAVVEQLLKDKPEIIIESVESFRKKQEEQQMASAQEAIGKNMAFLAAADAPAVGASAADADVTVIEFFDYNCGYCKRALPDVQKIVGEDKKVRFVFHEMPILSDASMTAARYALAAHKQNKYFDYHVALMNHNGQKDASALEGIGKELGLDVEKLKADAASDEIGKVVQDSMKVAGEIGVNGTPAFIINGTLYPGYLGPDGLASSIASAREKGDNKGG